MVKRGCMVYVPIVVINEIKKIKNDDNVKSNVEAFKLMAEYAKRGRCNDDVEINPFFNSSKKKGPRRLF